MDAYGPVSLVVISFPGNAFQGEIAPAIRDLVEAGTIRMLDIVFVAKDAEGNLRSLELGDLDDDVFGEIDVMASDVASMLGESDIAQIGEMLDPDSSAALLLFENSWATRFATAMRDANGQVMMNELIPAAMVNTLANGEFDDQ